jgi:uncharacterized protein (DUF2147 family)
MGTLLLLLLMAAPLVSANPSRGLIGNWQTPDRSIVHVYACGSKICARLVHVAGSVKEKDDVMNPDVAKRSRALCGLVIGEGFKPQGSDHRDPQEADDGRLYDPESGRTYSGTMQVSGDELKLRGYIGISLIGRTEVWRREPGSVPACAR